MEVKDLLIMLAIGFFAMIITFLSGPFFAVPNLRFIVFLVFAAVWYFAFRTVKHRYTEYEYIMTNSVIDIDRITGRRKRKTVVSVDLHEVEIFAAIDDLEHNTEYTSSKKLYKVYDCTGMWNRDIYFVDMVGDKGTERVVFEPTVNMLENAYKFNPRKIFIKK